MLHPLQWIDDELRTLEAQGLRRDRGVREGPQSATQIVLRGKQAINFGSNDYLGLAGTPLIAAVHRAIDEFGWGSGASPVVCGRGGLHAELERQLAQFEGTEAALLFPSGFGANVGVVTALAGRGDIIFSDAKNHASLIDGCRLSGARTQVYPHRDVNYLRLVLQQAHGFRRRLIVTDSVFSMDGDLAPLAELAELAEQFTAMLIVDEAHATGVFGNLGRGLCEHLGVEDGVSVRVGTLSKALGSIGGFAVGSQTLVEWLFHRARTYFFSTAPPEAVAAAGLEALRLVRSEPARRMGLLERARQLRDQLRGEGWNLGDSESQIVPVFVGAPEQATAVSAALLERGLFVPGIRPPSVPEGESLLRISLSCEHTGPMLETLLAQLREQPPTSDRERR